MRRNDKGRGWLARLIALLAREPQNREELVDVLHDAEEHGILTAESLGMIERGLQVTEMQVREVMIPKKQMINIETNTPSEEVLHIVTESGHSRFPVFDPISKDIVGILLAKDILKYYVQNKMSAFKLNEILRPAIFTSQNKRLNILLKEFRINRNHLAIVLDEYGHVAGLVTIEDVLEQIVGNIEDEYDIDEEGGHIKKLNDGSYIVKASTTIEEFNQDFHAELDLTDGTIGHLILKQFDHLPTRGETCQIDRWRFKILHSDHSRIYLLDVKATRRKKIKK